MNSRTLILLAVLSLCLAACLPARRTGHPIIDGEVQDYATGEPIPGATVTYSSNNGLVTTSDEEGKFHFKGNNFFEIAFIGGEAPPLFARLYAEKDGYCSGESTGFNGFGGGGPNVEWNMVVPMLPESHIACQASKALQKSLAAGEGLDGWTIVIQTMKARGMTRDDGMLMMEMCPDTFSGMAQSDEARQMYSDFHKQVILGGAVWPPKQEVPPLCKEIPRLKELYKKGEALYVQESFPETILVLNEGLELLGDTYLFKNQTDTGDRRPALAEEYIEKQDFRQAALLKVNLFRERLESFEYKCQAVWYTEEE